MSEIDTFNAKWRADAQAVAWGADRILCRALSRYKLLVPAQDRALAPHIALDGVWEAPVTMVVLSQVKPGWRCVNVGANLGYYTILMADLVGASGRVTAYEPNPFLAELICENLWLNGLRERVNVRTCAASNKTGHMPFWYYKNRPMNGVLHEFGGDGEVIKIAVDVVRLDDEQLDRPVDLLLCDAEGTEPQVLAGMAETIAQSPNMNLLLEWTPRAYADHRALAHKLLELGFHPRLIGNDGKLHPMYDAAFADFDGTVRAPDGTAKGESFIMVYLSRGSERTENVRRTTTDEWAG